MIRLDGEHPGIVDAAIQFMNGLDYDDSDPPISPIVFNASVYSFADKYRIPALKPLATKKFKDAVQNSWDVIHFVAAPMEAYHSTPPTDRLLRDSVVQAAGGHIQELLSDALFRQALVDAPTFVVDLLQYPADR